MTSVSGGAAGSHEALLGRATGRIAPQDAAVAAARSR